MKEAVMVSTTPCNIVGVHMPYSLCSRLGCYVSIDNRKPGIAKQVGHSALLGSSFFQFVVVVDKNIDVFNKKDVLWAAASYTDPSQSGIYKQNPRTKAGECNT